MSVVAHFNPLYYAVQASRAEPRRRAGRAPGSVLADYDLGGLDHGLDDVAFSESQTLRGLPGDRRHDLLAAGQADDNGRHDHTVFDANHHAVQLVPCAQSHDRDANGE